MSSAAPAAIRPLRPRSGMPRCAAANTPRIEPNVFAEYTAPMDFSP